MPFSQDTTNIIILWFSMFREMFPGFEDDFLFLRFEKTFFLEPHVHKALAIIVINALSIKKTILF